MIDGVMSHGTLSDHTLRIKTEPISSHHLIGQPHAVDGSDKFDTLFLHLQCGRDGWIAAIGKECFRFTSRDSEPFKYRKGFSYIRAGSTMDFVIGNDLGLSCIVAGFGDLQTVS